MVLTLSYPNQASVPFGTLSPRQILSCFVARSRQLGKEEDSLAHRHDGTIGVAIVAPRDLVVRAGVRAAGDAVEAGRGVARGRRERAGGFLAGVVHDGELPGRGVFLLVGVWRG